MTGHWTVDDESASSPILEGPSGFRISDCSAHWSGWEDEDFDALVACVRDAGTLAAARQLAHRLDQRIDPDGVPVDREATVTALLALLRTDR